MPVESGMRVYCVPFVILLWERKCKAGVGVEVEVNGTSVAGLKHLGNRRQVGKLSATLETNGTRLDALARVFREVQHLT